MTSPKNKETSFAETLDAAELARAYRSKYGIDTQRFYSGPIQCRQDPETDLYLFEPADGGDEDFYRDLSHKLHWYYQEHKTEFETAARHTRDKVVLDIGCGEGRFAAVARARSFVGLELNRDAATKGRKRGLDIREESLEFFSAENANSFDTVCAFQVLEHVRDAVRFLDLASKCLRIGGRLIVSVPARESFVGRARNNILNMPPHHLSHWPDSSFPKLASLIGLELEEVVHEPLDSIHAHWYAGTVIGRGVERLLGIEAKMLDFSFRGRIIDLVAASLGRIAAPFVRLRAGSIDGHTVTAILVKR